MKMSFTFSVSKISELFWNLNEKFIIILGGIGHKIGHRIGLKSVTLGRMTKLGLEWSKGPDLLLPRWGHRSIVVDNQIYHIAGYGKTVMYVSFYIYLIHNFEATY